MEYNWRTPPEPISPDRITQTLTADVVILGGGQAGTCAARAAEEHGAQVIVLEKNTERRHRYNGGGQIGHIEVGRDNIGARPALYLAMGSYEIVSGTGTMEDPFEIAPANAAGL